MLSIYREGSKVVLDMLGIYKEGPKVVIEGAIIHESKEVCIQNRKD